MGFCRNRLYYYSSSLEEVGKTPIRKTFKKYRHGTLFLQWFDTIFVFIKSKPVNAIPNRIVIYPKDVMNITGRRERTARKLLTRIRKHYNKGNHAFISIDEFCLFTGLKEEKVHPFLM